MPFQLKCPHDLLELSGNRSGVKVKAKAGKLHRDGRPACSRSMKTQEVHRAAGKRDRIHAWMTRVIFVFVAQRSIDQVRRNLFQRRPDPKFLVGTKRDPEQFAVAITHALGKRNPIKQGRLWHRQPDCSDNCTKNNSLTKRTAQIANCWGARAASRAAAGGLASGSLAADGQ